MYICCIGVIVSTRGNISFLVRKLLFPRHETVETSLIFYLFNQFSMIILPLGVSTDSG